MKQRASLYALIACWLLQLYAGVFYYPKWNKPFTEATISWDVSGYYMYLPALFIYKDIKQLGFAGDVLSKYAPTPDLQQAFLHRSGNYVMKYTSGMAVQYLPAFAVGHLVAQVSDYPADGYSAPYQVALGLWSLMIALLGVWLLRKVLLRYFSETVSAVTLITIVFATNYLDYSAINSALTHNYLFTLYALLIWLTIRFYENPSRGWAVAIGAVVGLATLTRPTEAISIIIPLLWGMQFPLWNGLKERFGFVKKHFKKFLLAGLACVVIGSIQLVYWKLVGGEWTINGYQNQKFTWERPHLYDAFLNYRSGWLIYTPIMWVSIIGFVLMAVRRSSMVVAGLLFTLAFTYIVVSWDEWWYGASLGLRAMVQAYVILAFPLAAVISTALKSRAGQILGAAILGVCTYFNVWMTHQAHRGGMYVSGEMTKEYFWRVVGKWNLDREDYKLLDHPEVFRGEQQQAVVLFEEDFESDSGYAYCGANAIDGVRSACIDADHPFTPLYSTPLVPDRTWVRVSATFEADRIEQNFWFMPQLIARFTSGGVTVKQSSIRIHRLLTAGIARECWIDLQIPAAADSVSAYLWNANGSKPTVMDNLRIEAFN